MNDISPPPVADGAADGREPVDRQAILSGLAANWNAREIRDLATSLLRLADSLDQDWQPHHSRPASRSIFSWPSKLKRIESNALNLAMKARLEYERRRRRKEHLPAALLGEPAWDMLLDLFMQYAGGAKVSTSSLCIASDSPHSTALRHIAQLEEAGLVKRSPSAHDKRITFVELTEEGVLAMGEYLDDV